MKQVGSVLGNAGGLDHGAAAPVYLYRRNGSALELLPYDGAEALLKQVTATPLVDVTGDLSRGFAWPVPGSHPRCSYAVTPLAAPVWPHTAHPTAVAVELWWPPDQQGRRLVRSFTLWADSPYNAYLVACCLWCRPATGGGAEAAFLYGPDRRVAYRISDAAWTCSNIPAETIARVVATVADRETTDPLPDTPRTSAMQEQRIEGTLTYTGTSAEISTCLKAHADSREVSMDAPSAFELRKAADEVEKGARTERAESDMMPVLSLG